MSRHEMVGHYSSGHYSAIRRVKSPLFIMSFLVYVGAAVSASHSAVSGPAIALHSQVSSVSISIRMVHFGVPKIHYTR